MFNKCAILKDPFSGSYNFWGRKKEFPKTLFLAKKKKNREKSQFGGKLLKNQNPQKTKF